MCRILIGETLNLKSVSYFDIMSSKNRFGES
ncbi:hypothetical protein CAEBREN_13222 [Caenorhabditis brenneri]|uniref:Uncharacterized protein n=1 Tax=Caenorhabditis brenneri TaxID=135651 RepID=G0N463_CAEBE|nr:hypothetical protein CAEBREN_13222 [Caenorhabditis brenneri]